MCDNPTFELVTAFLQWYADPARTLDEAFSAELLIESALAQDASAKGKAPPTYEALHRRRCARRDNPAHRRTFTPEQIEAALPYLREMKAFEGDGYDDRPVRSLEPLRFFPRCREVRWRGAITDSSPIRDLSLQRIDVHDDLLLELDLQRSPDLQHFSFYSNEAWPAVRGLEIPQAISWFSWRANLLAAPAGAPIRAGACATFENWGGCNTPLRDLHQLPALPEVRKLMIGATDSLVGGHFPAVKTLTIAGPFRDVGPLAGLDQLVDLTLKGEHFHDLSPLARLPRLMRLTLERSTPLDLTPLAESNSLRVVRLPDCRLLDTELAALHAGFPSWEDEFLLSEPRPLEPWAIRVGKLRKQAEGHAEIDFRARIPLFEIEAYAQGEINVVRVLLQRHLDAFLGQGWGFVSPFLVGGLMPLDIARPEDISKLHEIVDLVRRISAQCRYPWEFSIEVKPGAEPEDSEEEREYVERQFGDARYKERAFDAAREKADHEYFNRLRREHRERLEREHRFRLQQEHGVAIDPAAFAVEPPKQEPTVTEPRVGCPDSNFIVSVSVTGVWVYPHQLDRAVSVLGYTPEPGIPEPFDPTRFVTPEAPTAPPLPSCVDKPTEPAAHPPAKSAAAPAPETTLAAWLRQPARTNDELCSAEILIRAAVSCWNREHKIDEPFDWETRELERLERLENPAFRPTFTRKQIERAESFRERVTQFDGGSWFERPVRSLTPLAFFPHVEQVQVHGTIPDLAPLARLPLQSLKLDERSPTFDLQALAGHSSLRRLTLQVAAAWPQLAALGSLPGLEEIDLAGNLLALDGAATWPRVRRASLRGDPWKTPLRSGSDVPALPATQILTLGPIRSLAGLRCPAVRNAVLIGEFRDLGPLAAWSELTSLELRGSGFDDLTPLARLPRLRELILTRDSPLDLSPLSASESLREVRMPNCPMLATELSALLAGFAPWSADFGATPARTLRPWRFLCYADHAKLHARFAQGRQRREDELSDPALQEAECRWFHDLLQQRLDGLLGQGWGLVEGRLTTGTTRLLLKRYEDVNRLEEVIEILRAASAAARFPWIHWLVCEPHGDMSDTLEEIARRHRKPTDDEPFDAAEARAEWELFLQRQRAREAQLEREHRYRLQLELGREIDPTEFSPRSSRGVRGDAGGGPSVAEAKGGAEDADRDDEEKSIDDDDEPYADTDGEELGDLLHAQYFVTEFHVWLPETLRPEGEYLLGRVAEDGIDPLDPHL